MPVFSDTWRWRSAAHCEYWMHEKWEKYVFLPTWKAYVKQYMQSEVWQWNCKVRVWRLSWWIKVCIYLQLLTGLKSQLTPRRFPLSSFHFQSKFKLVWLHQVSFLFLDHWVVQLVWLAETPAKLVLLQIHENNLSNLYSWSVILHFRAKMLFQYPIKVPYQAKCPKHSLV